MTEATLAYNLSSTLVQIYKSVDPNLQYPHLC